MYLFLSYFTKELLKRYLSINSNLTKMYILSDFSEGFNKQINIQNYLFIAILVKQKIWDTKNESFGNIF